MLARTIRASLVGALLVAMIAAAPSVAMPPLATAAVVKADFPTARAVAKTMSGRGKWVRNLSPANFVPLGHNPQGCSSEQAFPHAQAWRYGYYMGKLNGRPKEHGWVTVSVFHFADPVAAATDFAGLGAWVGACPQVREWYCEQCDGLTDYTRSQLAPLAFAGGALTWNEIHGSEVLSGGRAIAQLVGSTVLVVWAGYANFDVSNKVPKPPSLTRTKSLARTTIAVSLN